MATTDAAARARFRRYWAALSPGILLIRWAMLRRLRAEAERRAHEAAPTVAPPANGHAVPAYVA